MPERAEPTTSPADQTAGGTPRPPLLERLAELGPWPLRAAWLLLPFTAGAAVASALEERSSAVGLTAAALAWALWAVTLLATYLAHPLALTALRLGAPTVVAGTVAAIVVGRPGALVLFAAIAVAFGAGGLALSAATTDRCVDGASYGPERRLALRVPLPLLLGPLPLAWAVAVGGVAVGPLLLAARQWVPGGLVTVAGAAGAVVAVRAVHGLADRFVVLVPAGFVLHDRAALQEPVLFTRAAVASLGPALADTTATDLTMRAAGLVLEVRLAEPLGVPVRTGRQTSEVRTVEAVLFSPVQPGRLLAAAAAHRLPVG